MKRAIRIRDRTFALAITTALVMIVSLSNRAAAQSKSSDGWIEEPGVKSLDVDGGSGVRAYLDSASVHRGDDGLVYFVESSNVARSEDIGKVGLMKDAYDCAKDVKYVCVGNTNWRNDLKSTVKAANEPALPVYRKYLCGD